MLEREKVSVECVTELEKAVEKCNDDVSTLYDGTAHGM